MPASAGSPLSAASTVQPSMSGIMTSSVIAAGRASRARRRPSMPLAAVITENPCLTRKRSMRSRTAGSSSITSTVRPVLLDGSGAGAGTLGRDAGSASARSGVRASAGRRTVKVEPCPGALATVMSPPIIRQRRRLIASPSPVPPYLRVVEASAWVNASNSFPICSGVMPMPVSEIAMVTQSRPPSSGQRLTSTRIIPRSVNLLALLARLSSAWRSRVGSARIAPTSAGPPPDLVAVLDASCRTVATTSSTRGPTATDSSESSSCPLRSSRDPGCR